jgi:hypothetical protein
MREAIEQVIADFEMRRMVCKKHKNQAGADAFLYAITLLKEILANE